MYCDDCFIPHWVSYVAVYILNEEIVAFQILQSENEVARFGPIVSLPAGAQVRTCGEGFNERTLKVRYEGSFYFVLVQDLESHSKAQARA
jgi:hypothetical protein